MSRTLHMADLFCGAGGTSTGAIQAATALGYSVRLTAINHWKTAVDTHTLNHEGARHLCASLDALNPRDLYKPGELDLLWASPECTHHSVARGGKPIHDQSRATAWCVVRWAEALQPPAILIENVPEFATWGPIGTNGRPMKSRKGETFRAWCAALTSCGYTVDHRILCAADYGDPTTRRRLFIQAIRGRRKIAWPTPSHSPSGNSDLFGAKKAWRAAREIIDWTLPGASIYTRKRPLSPNTLARIHAGLVKFGLGPFIVEACHGNDRATDNARRARDISEPLGTVPCSNRFAVADPFIISAGGPKCPARPVSKPLGTVLTRDHRALVEPFLITMEHAGSVRSIGRPLPTITTAKGGAIALAHPFLIPQQSPGAPRSVDQPAPTVSTAGAIGLVEPFFVEYYGNGGARRCTEPLPTVTTHERFGLVRPEVRVKGKRYLLDVRFRMLQPHELAGAQGFPADYRFSGNKTEIVKQIGNAVPVGLTRALVSAVLAA